MEGNKYDAGAVFLIDKPHGWSSFKVVKQIRYHTKAKKVGHAGTLDPLATGLLILCTGKLTKQIDTFQGLPKEYTGIFVLGQTSASYDLESELVKGGDYTSLTEDQIRQAAISFIGEKLQTPPIFSAVKVDGVRAYKKARSGQEVIIQPKLVNIAIFDIVKISLPEIHFKVICSKGTYIRSLARDFGEVLGCGAYMSSLRREAIGEYRVDNARTPEAWIAQLQAEREM